jgi:hypothetical protein
MDSGTLAEVLIVVFAPLLLGLLMKRMGRYIVTGR